MPIAFSPPFIDESIIDEVVQTLQSGWITTGPKTKTLENEVAAYCGVDYAVAVNSATSAMMLALTWYGVGQNDEVIIPAYTYCATALAVIHLGAKPVMVDVTDDFNIDSEAISHAISTKTKAIIAVDFGGWPCDYDAIYSVLNSEEARSLYNPSNENQLLLQRPLLLADSAHGIGAVYKRNRSGSVADFTVFSLHAVKNVTAAEGGLICCNLPIPFDNGAIYRSLKLWSLNGQTKDAYSKSLAGNWRYDIVLPGYKMSLPDVLAAIALAQLRKYNELLQVERKRIFDFYNSQFSRCEWAICPPFVSDDRSTSYHLYPLRIKNCTEDERNRVIEIITGFDISVNVHFVPLPLLSYFNAIGYDISKFPKAYSLYANEISLPIYPQLTSENCREIVFALKHAVTAVLSKSQPELVCETGSF